METQLLKYPKNPPSFKIKKENKQPTLCFSTCKSNIIFESNQQKKNLASTKQQWKSQSQTNVINFPIHNKTKFQNLNLQFSSRSNTQSKKVLHNIQSQSGNIYIDSEYEQLKQFKQNPLVFKNRMQQPLQSIENRMNIQKSLNNYSCSIQKNKSSQTQKQTLPNLQFNQKSPKLSNVTSKQNIISKDQQSPPSSLLFHPLQKQVMQMKQQMKIIRSNSINHNQTIFKQRQQHAHMKKQFILQISSLKQQISHLNKKLIQKESQFQQKSNMFLEEINQLIKDRHVLQIKLDSLIIPSKFQGNQKQRYFKQLQLKLDQKNNIILQLCNKNIQLQSQISALRFELNNEKIKTQKLNPINFPSQLHFFEQSLKLNVDEISKYKLLLQTKDQQIRNIKQINETMIRQIQKSKNEGLINQLKKVIQIGNQKNNLLSLDNIKTQSNQIFELRKRTFTQQNSIINKQNQKGRQFCCIKGQSYLKMI